MVSSEAFLLVLFSVFLFVEISRVLMGRANFPSCDPSVILT